MTEVSIPQLVGAGLSIVSPLVTILVLYKVGLIGKKNGNGNGYHDRITDLEKFKEVAEGNHFHEIKGLSDEFGRFQKDFNEYRIENEKRFNRIENKLFRK